MIFINAEPSRQVLVLELLLDLNERARGRRGHQDVRMWTEGIGQRAAGGRKGGAHFLGDGVTRRAVSCHHSPTPPETGRAPPSGSRLGHRAATAGRCQRWHVSPGYGAAVASAPNWLIVVIIWVGRSSWHWGCLEGHSHTGGIVCVCVCVSVCVCEWRSSILDIGDGV